MKAKMFNHFGFRIYEIYFLTYSFFLFILLFLHLISIKLESSLVQYFNDGSRYAQML